MKPRGQAGRLAVKGGRRPSGNPTRSALDGGYQRPGLTSGGEQSLSSSLDKRRRRPSALSTETAVSTSAQSPNDERERSTSVSPPLSDRGAVITGEGEERGRVAVSVDHLAVTFKTAPLSDVMERLANTLPLGEFMQADRGMLGYHNMLLGCGRTKVLWGTNEARRANESHVILPGEACRLLGEREMRELLTWISDVGGTCTRIDLAGDDFEKRATPDEFREHRLGPTVVTKTRPGRWFVDDCTGGRTYYVGSRSSRMCMRVYDKAVESRGAIDSIRFELEAKAEGAVQLQRELIGGHWGSLWASHLVTLIDFRERWVDSNVARCPRVAWFESLVGDATKAAPYLARRLPSLNEAKDWFIRQCGPTLAALVIAGAGDVVYEALDEGPRHFRAKHRYLVAQGKAPVAGPA
jgi:Replication initiation factor